MKKTTSGKASLGSGKGTISIGDWPPKACENFTFGFYLSTDDVLAKEYINQLKAYIDLDAFDDGAAVTVLEAISQMPWEALTVEARRFLARYQFVKIAKAHIQLQKRA